MLGKDDRNPGKLSRKELWNLSNLSTIGVLLIHWDIIDNNFFQRGDDNYVHCSEDVRLIREEMTKDLAASPQTCIIIDPKDWIDSLFPTSNARQKISDFVDGCPTL